jgi:hypothetical protein
MTSVLDVRLGAQRPTHLWVPPGRVSSAGPEYIEFGQEVGLFLDEWQEWHLDEALAERADGNPVADEVGLLVPRQNGKDEELLVLEIGDLWIAELPLVLHSAHLWPTAFEHFLRLRAVIEASPELLEDVDHIYTGNGNCGIVLKSKCRIKFVARSKGSGAGFAGVKRNIYNEAFALTYAQTGASGPTTLTPTDDQTWYVSSPPHVDSEVLHDVRKRGIAGGDEAGRLFFAAWENPPGTECDDWDSIARANPAFGRRITQESFEGVRRKIGPVEFARECVGIAEAPDGGATVFGPGNWEQCRDETSRIDGEVKLALSVSPDMQSAAFGVAGFRSDGLPHIEVAERGEGTGWVVQVAKELTELHGPLLVDPKSPTGGLLKALDKAGVPVVELEAGDLPKACSAFQAAVMEHEVRHIGQGPLEQAVNGAAVRPSGAGLWVWAPRNAEADISPLECLTLALFALESESEADFFVV